MKYLLSIVVCFVLLYCSNSTNNDDDKDRTREFSAQIDGKNFIPDSVEVILYYYSSNWRVYIDAFNDTSYSDYIRISLDQFNTDGQKIPETTYNLNAITNRASFSYGKRINGGFIGIGSCLEGVVKVTDCDSEEQTFSGEFSFRPYTPSDTIVVSNGIFRNIPYKIISN